jgi:hypothetical protein
MNTTKISDLRIIFTKGNKCSQFGKTSGELGFKQVGTFRSDHENKYFNSTAEFMNALEKYLTNPSARIERLEVNGQVLGFNKYCSIEQGIAKHSVRFAVTLAVNQVN